MRFLLPTLACLLLLPAPPTGAQKPPEPADWPWWRGPDRNGVASGPMPPLKWSETENVLWKSPVPGRGHGSPIVVGDHVFLATAETDPETQSVLCFDRKTGRQLWQTIVHKGEIVKGGNAKSSHASSTPACDGERVFINFLNKNAIYTTALTRDGKKVWQKKAADYVLHQGFGSSPTIYGPLVIVSADNKGGGAIVAFDRASGKEVWRKARPKTPNYASPIVLQIDGRDQLVMTGCDKVAGFEPLSGKDLWEIKGSTTECVTSVVTDGKRVFTSGGYPKDHVSAVLADGSGKIAWEDGTRVYVPSMLQHKGHLYAVLDAGFAVCWKCDTGKETWRGRLNGLFSSSLVLVGENLFATNESGQTFIFKALPDRFASIGKNQLGREVFATPAVCGGRIYARVAATEKGKRQEMLYCLGKKE